jgi:hypothetical protein
MRIPRPALAAALALLLSACASAYAPESITGGFTEQRVSDTTWWVAYAGNGYTTAETVQTYWLYHAAELTLAKGFDGFQILSPVTLTQAEPQAGLIRAQVFLKPQLAGDIRFLKAPFTAVPGKVFDARRLKALLAPYVLDKRCGSNVCPHVHGYLFPEPA